MKKFLTKFLLVLAIGFTLLQSCSKKDDNTTSSPINSNFQTVTIATQTWMLKNLDVDHYRNGDPIPQVTDPSVLQALTTGAWCYYNNDPANEAIYGKLYNWYAVNDSRGLAPTGFHVPTSTEWGTLINFLDPTANGGTSINNVAGDKMKATTGWASYSGITNTNSSGFTGLPGGEFNGPFYGITYGGYWWSSSEYSSTSAWMCALNYYNSIAYKNVSNMPSCFSVRCLRD